MSVESCMRKIVVSGATSMLGTALINVAVENNVEVYALVRNNPNRLSRIEDLPGVHLIFADIASLGEVKDIPTDCDVFYHFAWAGTSKEQREDAYIQENNIRYTLDAVDLAHRCGCKKFVGAGSQAEYGPTEGVIDDATRCNPVTAYGAAKLSAGILSKKLCEKYGMIHIWTRVFSVYGPHDNAGTMLNYAIDKFSKKEEARFSAATQMWNYLYETDAGMMFYLIGEKVEESKLYRFANRDSRPLKEFIYDIASYMHSEDKCIFAEEESCACGIETCDDSLFSDIDYQPQVGFRFGIKSIISARNE